MSHATHANAALTPRARLRLARLIVDHGWPPARAAERYDVSWRTAKKWADRYRDEGPAGMVDRSSRAAPPAEPDPGAGGPQDRAPAAGSSGWVRSRSATGSGCRPRPCTRSWSGAGSTGSPTSTGPPASRSAATSTSTRRPDPRRRQEARQGPRRRRLALRRPPAGHEEPVRNRSADRTPKSKYRQPLIGTCYLHTVIDDHSRVAYVEAHDDETKETADRGAAQRGRLVRRPRRHRAAGAVSDNGGCYRSYLWRDTCAELGITPKRTRPYRPQTNGKIERFHRTLAEGWAFKKFYNSESARLAALPAWVHQYNHHRPHSAIGKAAPITRLNNLAGHHR